MKQNRQQSLPCAPGGVPVGRLRRNLFGGFPGTGAACLLACALLAVSCTKEPAEVEAGGRIEITPAASFTRGVEASSEAMGLPSGATRAVADPSSEMELWFARADETASGSWGTWGDAALKATRTAGTAAQALTFAPVQYYPANNLKTKMLGWHPGGGTAAGQGNGYYDATAGTVTWRIDGSQDILTAPLREGSSRTQLGEFTFAHLLSQVQIHIYGDEGASAQWGKVLSASVLGQRRDAALTVAGVTEDAAPVAFSGSEDNTFAAQNFTAQVAPEGKDNAVAPGDPVMIEPQADANYRLMLSLSTELGGKVVVTAPAHAYKAGEAVKLYVKFTNLDVEIDPKVTIAEWQDGGDAPAGPSDTYPYVTGGNTVVVKDAYGQADPQQYPVHDAVWRTAPRHTESTWNANTSGNNTCAARFMVAKSNAPFQSTECWWQAAGVQNDDYNPDGYSNCGQYSEEADQSDKGQWRLPTVRELKLAFDLMNQLAPANKPANDVYWVVTERAPMDGNDAWRVRYDGGTNAPYVFAKGNGARVRCVRDLASDAYPYVMGGNTVVVKDLYGQADETLYPTHTWWSVTPQHTEAAWNNNTSDNNSVGESFEVAEANAVSATGAETMTWYEAYGQINTTYNTSGYSACASYSQGADDAGGWRLPTIRELKLIYDKKSELTVAPPTEHKFYWSVTQKNATGSWGTYFDTGVTDGGHHGTYYVRCVRDVGRSLPIVSGGRFVKSTDDGMQADYPVRNGVWASNPERREPTWDGNTTGGNSVSAWFEVAENDIAAIKGYQVNGGNSCAGYSQESGPAGTWRAPTTRELKLIYDKKDELTGVSPFQNSAYWAGTRYSYDDFWFINFSTGEISHSNHNASQRPVRCVRDISPTVPYVIGGRMILSTNGIRNAAYPIRTDKWTTTPAHTEDAWNTNASGKNTVGQWIEVANSIIGNITLPNGISMCSNYVEKEDQSDKGLWRVPTIREMSAIDMVAGQLTTELPDNYWVWSRTERTGGEVWCWHFGSGAAEHHPSLYGGSLLCVRDL